MVIWRQTGKSAKLCGQRGEADHRGGKGYLLLSQQELHQRLDLLVGQVGRESRGH